MCSVYARESRRYVPQPRREPVPQTIQHHHPQHRTCLQPTFYQVLALPHVKLVILTSPNSTTIPWYYIGNHDLQLRTTKKRNCYKIWTKILGSARDSKRIRARTSWIVLIPRKNHKRRDQSEKGKIITSKDGPRFRNRRVTNRERRNGRSLD